MNIMSIVGVVTGEEMKTIRDGLGMTQKEFAEKLGVTTQTVSRYERNAEPIPRYMELAMEHLEAQKKKR